MWDGAQDAILEISVKKGGNHENNHDLEPKRWSRLWKVSNYGKLSPIFLINRGLGL